MKSGRAHHALDTDHMTDEEIVGICKGQPRNMECLSALVRKYMPVIRKNALGFENERVSREDLSQEAMLAFLKAVETYDASRGTFSSYASVCMRNRMISLLRSGGDDEKLSDEMDAEEDDTTPETIYMEHELISELSALLSEREMNVLRLSLDGLSYHEIAGELGVNEKSVDNAVQRIRKKLRESRGDII
ncbi:MAG: sigma-70 family RNA polymerase sigma factor [Oscillospiraceae bacterium]|nr:sigma-70 family RNA polymerase sigma factor [Oscillospiraceae bacterium]